MASTFLVYELFIFLSFTTFISLSCLTIDTAVTNPEHCRFAVSLIHRDSPLSPLYNPDFTFWDKAERFYESSIARHAYISSNRRSDRYRTEVFPNDFAYLAKLSIGAPAVDVFTLVDTGSELLWIQCEPCEHCQLQTAVQIYDRSKSSTYEGIACNSRFCNLAPDPRCDNHNTCLYHIQYADQSSTYGFLATEILSFKHAEGGVLNSVIGVVFGCGINNHIAVHGQLGGIIGLGADELSLVSQLRCLTQPKFSYCWGNASDSSSEGNLIIGEDAHVAGFTTSFMFDNFYRIFLREIKVDSQTLDLPPWAVGPSALMVLDTGTIYPFLKPEVHEKLAAAISKLMERFKMPPIAPDRTRHLCCKGNIGRDLNGFPTMTIGFIGKAELVLKRWSIFIQEADEKLCLAFLPTSDPHDPSIIGGMAQQFYNFGFDLQEKDLSIIHSFCIY